MPCTVQPWEQEQYEKEENKEVYGVAKLTDRITESVACEMGRMLEEAGLLGNASKMAQKWYSLHKKKDRKRKKGT